MGEKALNPVAVMAGATGLTMSSREIADLCEKRHDHVMRDIREMLVQLHGESNLPKFGGIEKDARNRDQPVFLLPKREALILVSGYRLDLRARIIDRWEELEAKDRADPMVSLNDPVALRGLLSNYAERVMELQGVIEEQRPQIEALDRIAVSDGSFCITDAAKTLQVRPKDLFAFLRHNGWIYSRLGGSEVAYQSKLASGLLEHKTTTVHRTDGSEKSVTQVRVTPKGLTRLAQEMPSVAKLVGA